MRGGAAHEALVDYIVVIVSAHGTRYVLTVITPSIICVSRFYLSRLLFSNYAGNPNSRIILEFSRRDYKLQCFL